MQNKAEKEIVVTGDELPAQMSRAMGAECSLPCIPFEPGMFRYRRAEDCTAWSSMEDADSKGEACRIAEGVAESAVFSAFEKTLCDRMHAKAAVYGITVSVPLPPVNFFAEGGAETTCSTSHVKAD